MNRKQKHIAFTARSEKDANSSGGVLPGGVTFGNTQTRETTTRNGGVSFQRTKLAQQEASDLEVERQENQSARPSIEKGGYQGRRGRQERKARLSRPAVTTLDGGIRQPLLGNQAASSRLDEDLRMTNPFIRTPEGRLVLSNQVAASRLDEDLRNPFIRTPEGRLVLSRSEPQRPCFNPPPRILTREPVESPTIRDEQRPKRPRYEGRSSHYQTLPKVRLLHPAVSTLDGEIMQPLPEDLLKMSQSRDPRLRARAQRAQVQKNNPEAD